LNVSDNPATGERLTMAKTAGPSLGVHRVVMRSDICWVVGVIDAYGAVKSVVQTFDEQPEAHEYLFGLHGRRFRKK